MIKQVYLQEKDFPQSCTECEYYTVGRVCIYGLVALYGMLIRGYG